MKTYLCIGAGPGISLATARRFAREGYRIVLVSRNPGGSSGLSKILKDDIRDIVYEAADAEDPVQISTLIAKYGNEVDVLHYNAGVLHYDGAGNLATNCIETQSMDEIATDININITGALITLSKIIPAMERRGSGTILLTGGGLGVDPAANLLTLSVGKAGIRAMTQALFEPLKAKNIHIASVRVSTLVASDRKHPALIAEEFWKLNVQPKNAWTWEIIYPLAA